jgi:hypothetical protein
LLTVAVEVLPEELDEPDELELSLDDEPDELEVEPEEVAVEPLEPVEVLLLVADEPLDAVLDAVPVLLVLALADGVTLVAGVAALLAVLVEPVDEVVDPVSPFRLPEAKLDALEALARPAL